MKAPVSAAKITARLAPAALALLLATGCVSLAPDYQRPALPVPEGYPAAGLPAAGDPGAGLPGAGHPEAGLPAPAPAEAPSPSPQDPAARIAWQRYFTDPALQRLIATALDNSRDLRAALLRVEEARALYGIQRSDQFPSVGVQAQGSRARVPADLNLTGQPQISSQYQAGLGMATWELDFWAGCAA